MNEYEKILPQLNNKHFYPNKTITMFKEGERVTGLWMNCAPILKDDRLAKLRAALPEGFIATFLPNISEIHIKKKNG